MNLRGDHEIAMMPNSEVEIVVASIWTGNTVTAVLGTGPVGADTLKSAGSAARGNTPRTSALRAQDSVVFAAQNAWTNIVLEEHATPCEV